MRLVTGVWLGVRRETGRSVGLVGKSLGVPRRGLGVVSCRLLVSRNGMGMVG